MDEKYSDLATFRLELISSLREALPEFDEYLSAELELNNFSADAITPEVIINIGVGLLIETFRDCGIAIKNDAFKSNFIDISSAVNLLIFLKKENIKSLLKISIANDTKSTQFIQLLNTDEFGYTDLLQNFIELLYTEISSDEIFNHLSFIEEYLESEQLFVNYLLGVFKIAGVTYNYTRNDGDDVGKWTTHITSILHKIENDQPDDIYEEVTEWLNKLLHIDGIALILKHVNDKEIYPAEQLILNEIYHAFKIDTVGYAEYYNHNDIELTDHIIELIGYIKLVDPINIVGGDK